jgi:hypothetical protein
MDYRKCQTPTATPAKPGDLPLALVCHCDIKIGRQLQDSWLCDGISSKSDNDNSYKSLKVDHGIPPRPP